MSKINKRSDITSASNYERKEYGLEHREEASPYYDIGAQEVYSTLEQRKADFAKRRQAEFDKDHRPVRGIFYNHERPGATVTFPFKKYDEPPFNLRLKDGEIYTIPYMIAKHLSENCYVQSFQGGINEYGKPFNRGAKIRRMTFQSLEFVDDPSLRPIGSGTIFTVDSFDNASNR